MPVGKVPLKIVGNNYSSLSLGHFSELNEEIFTLDGRERVEGRVRWKV